MVMGAGLSLPDEPAHRLEDSDDGDSLTVLSHPLDRGWLIFFCTPIRQTIRRKEIEVPKHRFLLTVYVYNIKHLEFSLSSATEHFVKH